VIALGIHLDRVASVGATLATSDNVHILAKDVDDFSLQSVYNM
jgi:hypothetical protein